MEHNNAIFGEGEIRVTLPGDHFKGIMSEEEWKKIVGDIRFDYVSDSHFAELKEYEIVNERMSVLRDVQEYVGQYYSLEYVRKNILRQTDREIEEIVQEEVLREKWGHHTHSYFN